VIQSIENENQLIESFC